MKPPAFQFYADDFVSGTVDLTAEEVGAYILLLCFQWSRGAIPSTPDGCNRVARCNVSQAVLDKFPGLKNPRLEAVRLDQEEWREKCRKAGIKSAEVRWGHGNGSYKGSVTNPVTKPVTNGQLKGNSPVSSLHTPIEEEKKGAGEEHSGGSRKPLTTIPTVEEVIQAGGRIGLTPEACRQWHSDMAANGWADRNGIDIGNWRYWLTGHKNRLQSQPKANAGNSGGGSGTANLILAQKALERVERRMGEIRGSYDSHQSWTNSDRTEFRELKLERDRLKQQLGLKV